MSWTVRGANRTVIAYELYIPEDYEQPRILGVYATLQEAEGIKAQLEAKWPHAPILLHEVYLIPSTVEEIEHTYKWELSGGLQGEP
jgi:hypothetical protein